jgi:hypothetical protein
MGTAPITSSSHERSEMREQLDQWPGCRCAYLGYLLRGFRLCSRSASRMVLPTISGMSWRSERTPFFDQVETTIDFVQPAVDLVQPAIDLIESLLCSCLEREQVLVNGFDLLGQETKRAFNLADTALRVTNLSFDIHCHRKSVP